MNIRDIFNQKNIKNYIEGNFKYFQNKLTNGRPRHEIEQVVWRLSKCENDCLINNKCIYCGCPPKKKAFIKESCNDGERFPDLMNEEDWNKYKLENNIIINDESV